MRCCDWFSAGIKSLPAGAFLDHNTWRVGCLVVPSTSTHNHVDGWYWLSWLVTCGVIDLFKTHPIHKNKGHSAAFTAAAFNSRLIALPRESTLISNNSLDAILEITTIFSFRIDPEHSSHLGLFRAERIESNRQLLLFNFSYLVLIMDCRRRCYVISSYIISYKWLDSISDK